MQEEYEHAAPQNDESAFETILFRILLLTDEICTYVCVYMNIFLMFDVREQLVDDDGIKRYQGTNYSEFCANVSNSAPGLTTTIRMKILSALFSESFSSEYLFSSPFFVYQN